MIAAILKWLTGGGISAIGAELRAAYEARLKAQNDRERLEADMAIAQLQARQAVLLAEQGSWATRWIRPAFALPFIIYDAKIIVWDKVLGLGTTDGLSPELWRTYWIVLGGFFVLEWRVVR